MRESNDVNFNPIHHCTPKSSTDILVATIMQFRLNHTLIDRANKSFVGDLTSNPELAVKGSIQVSYSDSFTNLLIKCAVIHLTTFHKNMNNIMDCIDWIVEIVDCRDNCRDGL